MKQRPLADQYETYSVPVDDKFQKFYESLEGATSFSHLIQKNVLKKKIQEYTTVVEHVNKAAVECKRRKRQTDEYIALYAVYTKAFEEVEQYMTYVALAS